ncbi:MAG: hypothetical protein V3W52_17120 [Syntrophobacteria bacterium]
MKKQALTRTQQEVLSFSRLHIRMFDNFPTMKEISEYFGWSSNNNAHLHLKTLIKKGYIQHIPGGVRFMICRNYTKEAPPEDEA